MAPESSVKLVDVVVSLMRRDRLKEAVDWVMEAMFLGMTHGVEAEAMLRMPADRVIALLNRPPPEAEGEKPFVPVPLPHLAGWNRVYYGEAAFRDEE